MVCKIPYLNIDVTENIMLYLSPEKVISRHLALNQLGNITIFKKLYLNKRLQSISKNYIIKNVNSPGYNLMKKIIPFYFPRNGLVDHSWLFTFNGNGVLTNDEPLLHGHFTANIVNIKEAGSNNIIFKISGTFLANKLNGIYDMHHNYIYPDCIHIKASCQRK